MCVRETRDCSECISLPGSSYLRFFFAPNSLREVYDCLLFLFLSPTPAEKRILFRVTELTGRLTPSFGFSARDAPRPRPSSRYGMREVSPSPSSPPPYSLSLSPFLFVSLSPSLSSIPCHVSRLHRVELRHFECEEKREDVLPRSLQCILLIKNIRPMITIYYAIRIYYLVLACIWNL